MPNDLSAPRLPPAESSVHHFDGPPAGTRAGAVASCWCGPAIGCAHPGEVIPRPDNLRVILQHQHGRLMDQAAGSAGIWRHRLPVAAVQEGGAMGNPPRTAAPRRRRPGPLTEEWNECPRSTRCRRPDYALRRRILHKPVATR